MHKHSVFNKNLRIDDEGHIHIIVTFIQQHRYKPKKWNFRRSIWYWTSGTEKRPCNEFKYSHEKNNT